MNTCTNGKNLYLCNDFVLSNDVEPFILYFLRLIYDDVQPNNRTILTYDGTEYGSTDYPLVRVETNPFRNGVINFYYYICKSQQNNFVHPAGSFRSRAN